MHLGFKIQFTNPLQGTWSTVTTRGDGIKAGEFDASNETTVETAPVAVMESGKHKGTICLHLL